uniref:type I protein arginine methyltransferase n=1 Tax=Arcella intermedia TaxID=1963864 RepID=A0A6B2LAE3_9EUKA
MLKDRVRTNAYKRSIMENAHLIKNKVVLDVGCGTGILSLFAAKAGAAHVYAVDCSDIAIQAQQIVIDNGFKDKITVIHSKMEDVTLPCKVDVILSEWMGYFLLYESMLNTVIYARDRFLAPGGVILPDKASLYIATVEDAEYKAKKIEFWDNVYGFNMGCIKKVAYIEPIVDTVNGECLNSLPCRFFTIDLNTVKESDLSFTAPFQLKATRTDFAHALIAWFDVDFSRVHKPLSLTTSPKAPYTHWKQTVFYLEDVLILSEGDTISGTIDVRPNQKNPRDLDIKINVDYEGKWNEVHKTQEYLLR